MLDIIKTALRIDTDALDDELAMYIDAALYDMSRVGIVNASDEDAVVQVLTQLYVKWMLNWHEDGNRYQLAYEKMRDGLSLAGNYNGGEE